MFLSRNKPQRTKRQASGDRRRFERRPRAETLEKREMFAGNVTGWSAPSPIADRLSETQALVATQSPNAIMFTHALQPRTTISNVNLSMHNQAAARSGFGEISYQEFSGRVVGQVQVDGVVVGSHSLGISSALSSAWSLAKTTAARNIVQRLDGMKAGPVHVYDSNIHFGSMRLDAKPVGNGVLIRMTSTDNYLRFRTTTPNIPWLGFGLGSWANPRLHVDFNVSIEVLLTLDNANNLKATVQSGNITNLRTRGANPTGWLANAVTDVYQFMGGQNVRNLIQDVANVEIKKRIDKGPVSFSQRLLPSIPRTSESSGVQFNVVNGDVMITLWYSTKKYQPPIIK